MATDLVQFPRSRLPEDGEKLPERDGSVVVLIHLLDHVLETEVSLGRPQLLHHHFEVGDAENSSF